MISSLFKKKPNQRAIQEVYASIVAQSRQSIFYADWQVPDSVTGRFDMVALHMCMILRRLKTAKDEDREFSQSLFDWFFRDMDRSLREMGAGDMAVPKRIQKMGELFYGMLASIGDAIDEDDQVALQEALSRNIFGGEHPGSLQPIANYLISLDQDLNQIETPTILAGTLSMKAVA